MASFDHFLQFCSGHGVPFWLQGARVQEVHRLYRLRRSIQGRRGIGGVLEQDVCNSSGP